MKAVYDFRLLDNLFEIPRRMVSDDLIRSYLAYRVNHEPVDGNALLVCIRRVACELHNYGQMIEPDTLTIGAYVETLCWPLGDSRGKAWPARFHEIFCWNKPLSEEEYEKHLFAAGIRTNNLAVVRRCLAKNERLLSELQRLRSDNIIFGCYDELAGKFGGSEILACIMTTEVPVLDRKLRSTFLERAAINGRAEIVAFVYDFMKEESPWYFGDDFWANFHHTWLCRSLDTPSIEVLRFVADLRTRHTNVDIEGQYVDFPLDRCVLMGRLDTVEYAIQLGAHPRGSSFMMSRRANAPVRRACMRGHTAVVEYLLAAGAGTEGTIEIAAQWGRLQVVQRLLGIGVPPTKALEKAAAGGYLDVVRVLLDAGADTNETTGAKSPLASAIAKEHTAMFHLLIERGADVHATGVAEECVKRAQEDGLESMLRLLQSHGVDVGRG